MPGLFGGLVAAALIPGIAKAQLIGIGFTLALALVGGLICGFIIRATGVKKQIYEDDEEFVATEQKATVVEN